MWNWFNENVFDLGQVVGWILATTFSPIGIGIIITGTAILILKNTIW